MNFVAQLEDYLRDLGAEARKKHPGKLVFHHFCFLTFHVPLITTHIEVRFGFWLGAFAK